MGDRSGVVGRFRMGVCGAGVAAVLLVLAAPGSAQVETVPRERPDPATRQERFINELLSRGVDSVRTRNKLPALAVAVVESDGVKYLQASGRRVFAEGPEVGREDPWMITAASKAMTATLAGALVDEGVIGWETTLSEALPDLAAHPAYGDATLEQFLGHRAGIRTADGWVRERVRTVFQLSGAPRVQRLAASALVLEDEPAYAPGEGFGFSNFGYTVAASMMESAAGEPYEGLMRRHVFEPLGMESAGFGFPGQDGEAGAEPSAPWGHRMSGPNPTASDPATINADPAALRPAMGIHCTLIDFSRFVTQHMRAARRETDGLILEPETFEYLRTRWADDGGVALGWGVMPRRWAAGRVLRQTGTNGMWTFDVYIGPEVDVALIGATNIGSSPLVEESMRSVLSTAMESAYGGEPPVKPYDVPNTEPSDG